MIEVRDQFRRIAQAVAANAEVAGGTRHSTTTGNLREILVQGFLRPLLPRHFDILSGVIIDSNGNKSAQQDCIIVDSRMPLIDVGSDTVALVIAESVVATVEVKSFLDKGELLSSLDSTVRTKSLKRKGSLAYSKGPALVIAPEPLPILSYVFAFDGTDPNTLIQHVVDFAYGKIDDTVHDRSEITDAICILNKGVFLNGPMMPTIDGNVATLPALKEPKMTMLPLGKDALFAFYRRLCSDITYLQMRNFDLDAYYSDAELE